MSNDLETEIRLATRTRGLLVELSPSDVTMAAARCVEAAFQLDDWRVESIILITAVSLAKRAQDAMAARYQAQMVGLHRELATLRAQADKPRKKPATRKKASAAGATSAAKTAGARVIPFPVAASK